MKKTCINRFAMFVGALSSAFAAEKKSPGRSNIFRG